MTRAENITAEWLSGALGRDIVGWEANTESSSWSQQIPIRVRIAGEAAPIALRLKVGSTATFGASEVEYYRRDYADLPDAPLVRCWDAAVDETHYHLLLDDLSATHQNQFEVAPTLAFGLAVADALARLHAHHWNEPPPDGAAINRYFAATIPGLEPLIAATKDELTDAERATIYRTFAWHPDAMRARCADLRGFALVHGDVNPGNILAPKAGDGPIYLLDRQPFDWSLTRWLAVSDLAYWIVNWWPIEVRRPLEDAVVAEWHTCLTGRGVADYPLELARADYRLCAVQALYVAVEWCVNPDDVTKMRWVWEPKLRRALAAIADFREER